MSNSKSKSNSKRDLNNNIWVQIFKCLFWNFWKHQSRVNFSNRQ